MKISESIRAYSYLMLTSQAAVRRGILGNTAQSLAAQRIFYDNLDDVINKTISLKAEIGRYQSTLKYARSTLDYSVGKELYILPSDMLLKPLNQMIDGYNDNIIVNISGFELGKQHKLTLKQAAAKHDQKPVVNKQSSGESTLLTIIVTKLRVSFLLSEDYRFLLFGG